MPHLPVKNEKPHGQIHKLTNLQAVIASLTLLLWLFHKGRGKKEGFTLSIKAPYRSFHKPVSFC